MDSARFSKYATDFARSIAAGDVPERDDFLPIAKLPDERVEELFDGINVLRQTLAPQGIQLCTICNVKSGLCVEDCRFCAQASKSEAKIDTHPLLGQPLLRSFLSENSRAPIDRCSLVAAGRRVSEGEVAKIAEALESLPERSEHFCASLGLLGTNDLRRLREAGLTRYHCNLETARSHFASVATTHTYEDKLATVAAARELGLSLCVGGLFGIGETDEQVLELALDLLALQPQAVPVNFLVRIPGTPLAESAGISPQRCLKLISLLRFVLPRQDILVCGGRAQNLGQCHSSIFAAGASGIMTGNYLTTSGCMPEVDLRMLALLGLSARTQPDTGGTETNCSKGSFLAIKQMI